MLMRKYTPKNMELNLMQLRSVDKEECRFCLSSFSKERYSEISNSSAEIFRMASVHLVLFAYGHKTITVTFII
jgi:hypothetical protein